MKTVVEKEEKIEQNVQKISEAVNQRVQKDIRDLDWKNTLKLALVKQPLAWIFLIVILFSPYGADFVKFVASLFK